MPADLDLTTHIRDIVGFPKPGITFKDITPLLADPEALRSSISALAEPHRGTRVDKVLGIEARGFIFATPVALELGAGFVPVRKAGKLPWETEKESYALEYGTDHLEMHRDAVAPGERVLIIDDVVATGGTAAATARMVERLGGEVVGFGFLIELAFLDGRAALGSYPVQALVTYT